MFGKIVVIKRSGADGGTFPLVQKQCMFGRQTECDIRIQLPQVSQEHARIAVDDDGHVWLENLSDINPTMLNNSQLVKRNLLNDKDVFMIGDRCFRFEYPEGYSQQAPIMKVATPKLHPKSPLASQNSLTAEQLVSNNQAPRTPVIGSENTLTVPKSTGKKSTRVSFGPALSPEVFDKQQPVNTPLKKGTQTPKVRIGTPILKESARKSRLSRGAISPLIELNEEEKDQGTSLTDRHAISANPLPAFLRFDEPLVPEHVPMGITNGLLMNQLAQFETSIKAELTSKPLEKVAPIAAPVILSPVREEESPVSDAPIPFSLDEAPSIPTSEPTTQTSVSHVVDNAALDVVNHVKEENVTPKKSTFVFAASSTPLTQTMSCVKTTKLVKRLSSTSSSDGSSLTKRNSLPASFSVHNWTVPKVEQVSTQDISNAQPEIVVVTEQPSSSLNKEVVHPSTPQHVPEKSNFMGMREMFNTPAQNAPENFTGLREMVKTPFNTANGSQITYEGMREMLKTPKALPEANFVGMKELLKTPVAQKVENFTGVREMLNTPAQPSQENLVGVKEMLKTPTARPESDLSGLEEIMKTPAHFYHKKVVDVEHTSEADLSGLRNLVKTPKAFYQGEQQTNLVGVRELMKTPGQTKLTTNLTGIREMLNTPAKTMEPNFVGMREMMNTPTQPQAANLVGVREMMKTPMHPQQATNFIGMREMLNTPAPIAEPILLGVREMMNTPAVLHETNFLGVREMLNTPIPQNTSQNFVGLREMMNTPAVHQPLNNLVGVRELLKTPAAFKTEGSRESELEGMKELLQTPAINMPSVQPGSGISSSLKRKSISSATKLTRRRTVETIPEEQELPCITEDDAVPQRMDSENASIPVVDAVPASLVVEASRELALEEKTDVNVSEPPVVEEYTGRITRRKSLGLALVSAEKRKQPACDESDDEESINVVDSLKASEATPIPAPIFEKNSASSYGRRKSVAGRRNRQQATAPLITPSFDADEPVLTVTDVVDSSSSVPLEVQTVKEFVPAELHLEIQDQAVREIVPVEVPKALRRKSVGGKRAKTLLAEMKATQEQDSELDSHGSLTETLALANAFEQIVDDQASDAKVLKPKHPEKEKRVDVESMKVAELKEELRRRGLSVEGLKQELVQRLKTALEPCPPQHDRLPAVELTKHRLSTVPELDEQDTHFESFKVAELRELLAKYNLNSKGVKSELVERLKTFFSENHSHTTLELSSSAPTQEEAPILAPEPIVEEEGKTKGRKDSAKTAKKKPSHEIEQASEVAPMVVEEVIEAKATKRGGRLAAAPVVAPTVVPVKTLKRKLNQTEEPAAPVEQVKETPAPRASRAKRANLSEEPEVESVPAPKASIVARGSKKASLKVQEKEIESAPVVQIEPVSRSTRGIKKPTLSASVDPKPEPISTRRSARHT